MKNRTIVKIIVTVITLIFVAISIVCRLSRKKLSRTAEILITIIEWLFGTLMTFFRLQNLRERALIEEAIDDDDDDDDDLF